MTGPSGTDSDGEEDGGGEGADDGVLWSLEASTEAKHRLYARYLDAWFAILLQEQWVKRVTYIDAFAGPGEYEDGEPGSPTFALRNLLNHSRRAVMNLRRDRVTMIFLEAKRARCEHLQAHLVKNFGDLNKLPVHVEVVEGKAERDTIPLLTKFNAWGKGAPILAVFDSWGSVRVPLTTIARIASNPSSETIVTFGPNWFTRRENLDPDKLDLVFGGRDRWNPSNRDVRPSKRWQDWLQTYKAATKSAGHDYALNFEVMPASGHPLYLVFGTGHPYGVEVFKDAMWSVDRHDGMRFNDPRTNAAKVAELERYQGDLFTLLAGEPEDAPDKELRSMILERLENAPATLAEIRDWVLLETAYWRKSDAKPAVEFLIDQGLVERVTGQGRITGPTQLRLVAGPAAPDTPAGS